MMNLKEKSYDDLRDFLVYDQTLQLLRWPKGLPQASKCQVRDFYEKKIKKRKTFGKKVIY